MIVLIVTFIGIPLWIGAFALTAIAGQLRRIADINQRVAVNYAVDQVQEPDKRADDPADAA